MNTDDFHTRYAEELAGIGAGSPAVTGSAPTDTQRLEWLAKYEGMICRGKRMKTRRAGLVADNMEDVWTVEWEKGNGDLVMQAVDGGHATFRDAIDAAMKAQSGDDAMRRMNCTAEITPNRPDSQPNS